jgi:hypothetical protein
MEVPPSSLGSSGGRSWWWLCAALTWALSALVWCGPVLAIPPPARPQQALAIVDGGVVWFDDGPVLFKSFASGASRRLAANTYVTTSRQVPSSATAVAVLDGGNGLLAGMPPKPLARIATPELFSGGGCKGWQISRDSVIAGDDLVSAGECHWEDDAVSQPLLIRSLRGGHWRVLRWLPANSPSEHGLYDTVEPVLAADGDLIAVGVQRSSAKMEVLILDARDGRTQARFNLHDGYLSFASRHRLVLSEPAPRGPDEVDFPLYQWPGPFRLASYSTDGRLVSGLGTAQEPPLVSGMHLVTVEEGTVSVRSINGGRARAVIGFNGPAREMEAVAFRWPALVVVETTSDPLLPSEIHCWSGDYGPPSQAFLAIFDLARGGPFVAPPPRAHVEPSEPLTGCGPPPP